MTETSLLTPKETSKFLNIPVTTLQDWRLDGKGPPYFKVGSSVRYCPERLKAWLEANEIKAAS